jgi:K+/H+ antiporter YhaU regulatory subunit KhtT
MISSGKITIARYLKIAVNIASRIVSGELELGDKMKGRSVLSTEYNVSPETIRRAMSILSDKGVVKINIGRGITILSREKAVEFIKSFKDDERLTEMNLSLNQLFDRRKEIEQEISDTTRRIIDMYKYMRTDLIKPVEILLPENSRVIGKSIGQLAIWHNTGATIIGIVQENHVIISPGPYYEFAPDDSVLIVGDENVIERFNTFIHDI